MTGGKTVRVETGFKPRLWQQLVIRALVRFNVLIVHRRAGKTILALNLLIDGALRERRPLARFAYIAPLLKQGRGIAWDYLQLYTRAIPGVVVNKSELSVTLPNGAVIQIWGADNPDALRGTYLDGCVMDEISDMNPRVWGEIIRPSLADRDGWCVFIGTVRGINQLSELYYRALNDESGEWYATILRPEDTDSLSSEELAAMRAEMTDQQWAQEMECDFGAGADNTLIPLALAREAAGKSLAAADYAFAPKVLGVDVARYGTDKSVIFPRQGLAAFTPRVYSGIDNMEFAAQVVAAIVKFQPEAVFIDAGRGEGVIDRLRQLGHSVVEVPFGGRPMDARYADKRSEMYSEVEKWLRAGGALPSDERLIAQLCAPTFSWADSAGKFRLESKDSMRERGLPSPDIADALALTFAMPVRGTRDDLGRLPRRFADMDYEPLREAV